MLSKDNVSRTLELTAKRRHSVLTSCQDSNVNQNPWAPAALICDRKIPLGACWSALGKENDDAQ